jgi:hypothetical protein
MVSLIAFSFVSLYTAIEIGGYSMEGKEASMVENAPLCLCGCGESVNRKNKTEWFRYVRGHQRRGKPGPWLGKPLPEYFKERISKSLLARHKGKRKRDFDPTGLGVYGTAEYRNARKRLVVGKPCGICGSTKNVQ